MRHTRTLFYTNDAGISVRIGTEAPFYLSDAPADTVDSTAQVIRSPGQDGARTYNVTRGQRRVHLKGTIVASGDKDNPVQAVLDKHKQQLCTAFDPRRFGTLLYHAAAGDYRLERCRPSATPAFGVRLGNSLSFSVELISDNALWTEDKVNLVTLGATHANIRFPWFLPKQGAPVGIVFADAIAHNPTAENILPWVEVYDTQGAFVNVVNQSTGAGIAIARTVDKYQKLVIDCAEYTVKLYNQAPDNTWVPDSDALNWVSPDSDLSAFAVVPGENIFNINENQPGAKPIMRIRWRAPVIGV